MNSRHVIMMLVLILFFVTDAAATHRTALVIGNSSYQISPLKNPVNDATDMAATLTRSGFAVSLKINADQRTIVTAIREFGRQIKQQGGVGLFYYAGHGIQVRGRNYLIPLEAVIESEGDVQFEAVDAAFVLSKMEDAGNDMNIVILDACRNNPFARNFRSGTQGLARMDAPKGSIIAYATAPGELAADGTGRNGIYTKYLIQNIQAPQLRLEDVFKNVRRAVVNETGNKQVPWESSSLMGQFYFTQAQPHPQTTSTTAKKDTSIDSSYEILFWESIKDSQDHRMFEAYLEKYPNGNFVSIAEINIKRYERQIPQPTSQKPIEKKNKNVTKHTDNLSSKIIPNPKKVDNELVDRWKFFRGGNVEAITIKDTNESHLKWTSSGWGTSPWRQIAYLGKQPLDNTKYIFKVDKNRCVEGDQGGFGEECTHIIKSESGDELTLFSGKKKLGTLKRIKSH
jgi:hypothetical protein